MIPLKNKRGFIDLDLNWPVFAILTAVGLLVVGLMFKAWSGMDFEVPMVTKIIVFVGVLPGAFVFTKMWFD